MKALITNNVDLELDYSFLPPDYLESIDEWWNEEDVESLKPEEKEMIIKKYGSLENYYEHFGLSSHRDSEPDDDDALPEPLQYQGPQTSRTSGDPKNDPKDNP